MPKENAKKDDQPEASPFITIVVCQLCKGILPAGQTPNEHLDLAHPDLFKTETFLRNRNKRF